MTPNVAVFGTSNGLFKDGYVAGISDMIGSDRTKNCSIGASSSFVWFATKALADFGESNWAVIDYCVNDALMIRLGSNTEFNWRASMLASIAELRSRGCQPVLLIMPSLFSLNGDNPILAIALDLAREYGIPYLNVYDLVPNALSAQPGLSQESFFRDPSHLHPEIARLIGQEIAAALPKLPTMGEYGTALTLPVKYTFKQIGEWIPNLPVVERSTALTSRKFVNVTEGNSLLVPVEPGQRVVGLALDLAKTCGAVRVSGDRQWVKSWTNSYFTQFIEKERAMVFSVLPMGGKVGSTDGFVTFEAVDDRAADLDEKYAKQSEASEFAPRLALAGVLLEEDASRTEIDLPYEAAPNLLDIVDPHLAARIAAVALAKQATLN